MKKVIKKIIYNYRSFKNNAPKSCIFYHGSRSVRSIFEGNNTIGHNAIIKNTFIGYGTYIAQNSKIESCKIGKYCAIGFESLIGAHPLHRVASIHPALYSTKRQYGFSYVSENLFQEYYYADEKNRISIIIGNDVWITAGSTKIVQGITIGDGAIILVDAVVTKDVPPYAIVGGVPAKVVGYRFELDEIDFLLKLKWWERDEAWIRQHANYFKDVRILRKIVLLEEPNLMK
nr:CatB-related O-acetyltransferase [uncultured Eisenbergiella sp.]